MNTETKKTMIGGFVVTALFLCTAAVFVFGSGNVLKKTYDYVLFFEHAVKGLSIGAPVSFRGVTIGMVKDIKLIVDMEKMTTDIPVIIQVDPSRWNTTGHDELSSAEEKIQMLVSKGLRAKLDLQSFVTGKYMISLDFYPDEPATYKGAVPELIEIPTIQGKLDKLASSLENLPFDDLFHSIFTTVQGIEGLVNSDDAKALMPHMNQTVGSIKALAVTADHEMTKLGRQLGGTVAQYKTLAENTDGHIGGLAKDYGTLAQTLTSEIKPLSGDIRAAANQISEGVESARALIGKAEGIVDKDSPFMIELTQALKELSLAARSIRVWADYLERHPEALIRGKGK